MPQSKVITSDGDERVDFKSRLSHKVDGLLTPTPAPAIEEPSVLFLPADHEKMGEAELLFTLTNNPELAHSRDSAVMAVNLLYGRAAKPTNISFKNVELTNPVPVPEFVAEIPARRKPSGVAPGFARVKDSAPERNTKETLKKEQFKQSLADRIQQKLTEPVAPAKKLEARVLLYPSHFEELSEADLHFALVNNPELKHSQDSALLAIDILKGRAQSEGMTLQSVQAVTPPRVVQKREPKELRANVRAKDITAFPPHDGDGEVILLPANYRELSETELGFVLTHTPELRHTPEAASLVLDVLFGRAEAHNVKFEVVQPQVLPDQHQPQPEAPAESRVLLLPANYRDFSATELHTVLLSTPELGHSVESASLTVSVITNAVLSPQGVELRLSEVTVEQASTPPKTARQRPADSSWVKVDLASLPSGTDRVVTLPRGFDAMTEQELVFVLVNRVAKSLALDIVDVLKGRRGLPVGIGLTVEE